MFYFYEVLLTFPHFLDINVLLLRGLFCFVIFFLRNE